MMSFAYNQDNEIALCSYPEKWRERPDEASATSMTRMVPNPTGNWKMRGEKSQKCLPLSRGAFLF